MIRQHTPSFWPRVLAFPPVLKRCTAEIDQVTTLALLDGLDFMPFTAEGDYAAFAAVYLMMEQKGVWGRVIYDWYKAFGGDPTYIQGQLYVSARVQGEFPPHPNTRDAIKDSDDDDPDGEREGVAAGVGGGGPDGGGGGGEVPVQERPAEVPPVH